MAPPSVATVQVENVEFPLVVKAPGSDKSFFLGGAGVRGLQIEDKFVKFTAIRVYLEDNAIPMLVAKWKGKTPEEFTDSGESFKDVNFITGAFEKFTQVTLIAILTGQQYAEKASENCEAILKCLGVYTDEEGKAIEKLKLILKDETFPPRSSILFTHSPKGYLTISFSNDHGSIPEVGGAVIENKLLLEAVLASIIGKNGVSSSKTEHGFQIISVIQTT